MRRGGEREFCDGQWQRHRLSHWHVSLEERIDGGDRVPSRVPQRGGIEGQWIDVRSRRRKARRQDYQGQDKIQEEEERLRVKEDFKFRQARVRYASREDRYYGDYDTGSDSSIARSARWGDRESVQALKDDVSTRHQFYYQRDQRPQQVQQWRNQRTYPARAQQKRVLDYAANQNVCDAETTEKEKDADSSLKRFVTFYITNFPPQASNFFLRKGFEVCGMLEEVFVANNRNRFGQVFGFVRYAKVRDVDKLLKALNNVCFGQYRVNAVLARFDRKVVREGEGVGGKKEVVEGRGAKVREREREKEPEGEKIMEGFMGSGEEGSKKAGGSEEGEAEGVRVGSVLVRVEGGGKKGF